MSDFDVVTPVYGTRQRESGRGTYTTLSITHANTVFVYDAISLQRRLGLYAHRSSTTASKTTHGYSDTRWGTPFHTEWTSIAIEAFLSWASRTRLQLVVDKREFAPKPAFRYESVWRWAEHLVETQRVTTSQSAANYVGGLLDSITLSSTILRPNFEQRRV